MASAGFDIAKAGWLYRQSSVLHRWKKNWFVLDRLGDLRYFENPDTPRAEERIVVRAAVLQIKSGPDCRKADPPEGVSQAKACYLELVMKDKESMLLCAESFDDMRAWQIALEEARTLPVPVQPPHVTTSTTTYVCPPGYYYGSPYYGGGYQGQIISPPPAQVLHTRGGTTIINAPPGQQIVYVDDAPYRYRRTYTTGIYPVPMFFW
ncbi:pleckstriny domain-containing family B member 2 [Biomphalaria glabrata]|uniref:Pleckstrin homology domain-containing family B member 2-like n=2 Tax=Biomphalaria TaxID=6525 RepID=A0A2C9KU19_BIOGL|nr:pleckstrin homology domain-containing family B member 2-like [Biomphalaria glabrata]KAI8751178.1 pleckstrin homology domain-containing family B member 2-like [Biomphalaria glabrata]KAI8772474.1 pleckstriny domain-containing family B member 2 [Biomphalaria glabrata]KAK0041423.1 pleckstriny domain-containing family B member 2 [Biomphalaria pfeifferi]